MTAHSQFKSWEEAVDWFRRQPENAELAREAYYDDPVEAAADRYWKSPEWAAIRGFLPLGRGNALDVGAGRGIASYALAREGFRVWALEPDPSPIVGTAAIRKLATSENLPIEIAQEQSERLPFGAGHFDLVFARAVLHHTRDLEAACQEFFRVLRPGGRFIAIREHIISRPGDLERFFAAHPLHGLYGGENAFLLSTYRSAIASAGFQIETVLTPLGSEINYAPQTRSSLRQELASRVSRIPVASGIVRMSLANAAMFDLAMAILSRFDNRPGRLYSFICRKSDTAQVAPTRNNVSAQPTSRT